MMHRLVSPIVTVIAVLLASCGGGGGGPMASTPIAPSTGSLPASASQPVSGTLTIGSPGSTALSLGRNVLFVSPATTHTAVFIDGAATASGASVVCSVVMGAGCTITWSAVLAVPGVHAFAIETDSGQNTPVNTVLSEGAGSYTIAPGSANTLTVASLNGIVTGATFTVATCSGVSPASLCNGTFALLEPAGNAIAYTGPTAVPTFGNSPTSGNVFDNGNVTLVSSAPAVGTITGTAQPAFSSLASGTLTVSGVDTTGVYAYQATCVAGANGSFGITIGGGTTPSGVVTATELAGLNPAVSLPARGVAVVGTPLSFTCTAGTISSSSGSLSVN